VPKTLFDDIEHPSAADWSRIAIRYAKLVFVYFID